jgi:hypothetical protein
MALVALRPVEDGDLDALFEQMRDPEGVRMAAFTPDDPDGTRTSRKPFSGWTPDARHRARARLAHGTRSTWPTGLQRRAGRQAIRPGGLVRGLPSVRLQSGSLRVSAPGAYHDSVKEQSSFGGGRVSRLLAWPRYGSASGCAGEQGVAWGTRPTGGWVRRRSSPGS